MTTGQDNGGSLQLKFPLLCCDNQDQLSLAHQMNKGKSLCPSGLTSWGTLLGASCCRSFAESSVYKACEAAMLVSIFLIKNLELRDTGYIHIKQSIMGRPGCWGLLWLNWRELVWGQG